VKFWAISEPFKKSINEHEEEEEGWEQWEPFYGYIFS
jgi:hypothetical protein